MGPLTSFGGNLEHMAEGYENHRTEKKKELDHFSNLRTVVHEEKNMFTRVRSAATFSTTRQVMQETTKMTEKPPLPKKSSFNLQIHERAFRPAMPVR